MPWHACPGENAICLALFLFGTLRTEVSFWASRFMPYSQVPIDASLRFLWLKELTAWGGGMVLSWSSAMLSFVFLCWFVLTSIRKQLCKMPQTEWLLWFHIIDPCSKHHCWRLCVQGWALESSASVFMYGNKQGGRHLPSLPLLPVLSSFLSVFLKGCIDTCFVPPLSSPLSF